MNISADILAIILNDCSNSAARRTGPDTQPRSGVVICMDVCNHLEDIRRSLELPQNAGIRAVCDAHQPGDMP